MLATQTSLSAPVDPRLLKPGAALRRLRPVKLGRIVEDLEWMGHQCQAAKILKQYGRLPKRTRGYLGRKSPHWTDTFREFLRSVESWDWFGIDWDMLDGSWQGWMEAGEEDYFSQWLYDIPIERYGFSDYDEGWPEQYPPMALIKVLLDGDWGSDFIGDLVEQYGLVADWHNIFQSQLWERLESHDFRHYGKPLCWLPEIAKIAVGRTGNDLMDTSNYFEDEPNTYTWAEDVEEAKRVYQEAKPWIEKLRQFLRWCDGPAEMQQVVDALVGHKERRKRKRANSLTMLERAMRPEVER